MKTTIFTKEQYKKLEIWALTLVYGFFTLSILINSRGDRSSIPYHFSEHHIQYNRFENHFMPLMIMGTIAYIVLMLLILVVEPYWEKEKSLWKTALHIVSLGAGTALIYSIANTYREAWRFANYATPEKTYQHIFFDSFAFVAIAFIVYSAYYLLKQTIGIVFLRLFFNVSNRESNSTYLKFGFGILVWLIILIFLINTAPEPIIAAWLIIVPYSGLVILLNVKWLIPSAKVKNFTHSSYIWNALIVIVGTDLLATMFFAGILNLHGPEAAVCFILIILWTIVAILPWSWYIYKLNTDKTTLVSALGKSDANLSFLRSQINPHFLFNALNTLYGTALQENAERTGEGIQKLGDMMRFMLQENTQDKIGLARDIDYLKNYIDLQKLRTSRSADITIETQIEEQINTLEIAPMLLIPFVENAFKHGISLQEASHIRITLQTVNKTVYFDVFNSIHHKAGNDPEKLKSGIGLENVKQRLALLYPGKHELIIRESAKEFFIHLTLQVD